MTCNLNNSKRCVHIKNLHQTLNLRKVHLVINLNQKEGLKPYIELNTKF